MTEFFYRPQGAWAADFIPTYAEGAFRLFYLHDWRDKERFGEGTPWYQISTTDFVQYAEHGEALARGGPDAQDLSVFTGSVIEAQGQYHLFYTGHNPHLREAGRPQEAVMHAVSDDLLTWRKLPEDRFFAPTDLYEKDDWRDPFVFWNAEKAEWHMLLAARLRTGPSRRRGCTALCVSKDLKTWETRPPFWAPGLYFTHECPDLFTLGDWHYLVFSEFSQSCQTRYRMSRSLDGPWLTPPDGSDTFDGRAFYAAKTASDGQRRFLFGWNATREGERDYAGWQWGGNLAVHELAQEADGTLSVRAPDTIDRAFPSTRDAIFAATLGACDVDTDAKAAALSAPGAFACALAGDLPERCKITTVVSFAPGTRACGLTLRASEDFESGYYVRLEPNENRLVFDAWPRPGDQSFMMGLSRPLALKPDTPLELKAFVDGSVCEIYANGKVALSARLYNLKTGQWGVFVEEGAARFARTQLATPEATA